MRSPLLFSVSTLFLLNDTLPLKVQLNFPEVTGTATSPISRPLFCTLPLFTSCVVKPVIAGTTSCRSMFLRSEEHTSELQSLMSSSYAVFCLKKKKKKHLQH